MFGEMQVTKIHAPFLAKGVPSVDIIDLTPYRSYHHTAQDSIDKCDSESLAAVGRVVLATLAELERRE
jgi:glutaminyl-peptide cyclotransferase